MYCSDDERKIYYGMAEILFFKKFKEEFGTWRIIKINGEYLPFDKLERELTVEAKVRYSGRPAEAIISQLEDGKVKVSFKDKQRAITKGQSVVFYQGNIVVGGGIIEEIL